MTRSSEFTYTPAWWVPGAHLQTLWGKLLPCAPEVPTRIERWHTPDDDEIEVRRLDPHPKIADSTPRLIILHGLEGTIRSHYLQRTLAQARARGWAADVLLFRGCNGEVNRARRFYHSGETTDIDFVVRRIVAEHPGCSIGMVGYSLGGNVLLKWLGEQGEHLPAQVRAAAAVSVPFDLERSSRRLEQGLSRVYARRFLRTLRLKALAKLERFPGLFDAHRLAGARTLFDFDDVVTAPVHGFASASDYYRRSSSQQYLVSIRRPTLLLSAYDDPFLPPEVLNDVAILALHNTFLSAEFYRRGGHVGFISGINPFHSHHFAEERVLDFLAGEIKTG